MKATFRWAAALLLPLALVAGACSSDDDSSDGGDSGSDSESTGELASLDLSDVDVSVGSKDFVEQFVLGEILIQSLEAGGATVDNQTNLGGTSVNREALLAGEIDMYWEYNGTGWTVHLAQENPSDDPDTLTADVRALDETENGIKWLGQSPFNDTYGFATSGEFAEENGPFDLQSMADYLAANPDASVCLETEFPNRPDGLVLFTDATGYEIPESQIEILDTNVIYQETATGSCDFGEVFTTDGRIPALEMELVEDPGVFILYNVSLTLPDAVYEQAPEAFDEIVDKVLAPLDEELMAELNRQVSVDGEDAADVARTYLQDQGLI